jgi:multiple sugar transport system permease protein
MSTEASVDMRVAQSERRRTTPWWKSRHKFLRGLWLAFLQIFMTVLVITFLLPTIWMVVSSFKASTEIFTHPIKWVPDKLLWRNYVEAATILPFFRFTFNSLVVTTLATLGTVMSSAFVAYSFARLRWPGRDFFFSLLLATIMLPEVITLVPKFIMFRTFGWVDTFLPLTVPYWMANASIYVFLIRQFMRGIPMELEDAACIDGASRFRIFWQIVVPLSKPVLVTVAIFSVLQHYNDFMGPLIYLNSMTNWTMALGVRAYNQGLYGTHWELVFAVSTMMMVPMVILFVAAQRYFTRGITMTGFGGR